MAKLVKKNTKGYNYKYADISEVHKFLDDNGWDYYQYIEVIEGNDYIMTVPIINGDEQPARRGCRVVNATLKGTDNPAQEHGSAITYARRYSLLMAFGLATTDDDASCMSRPKNEKVSKNHINAIVAKCNEKSVDIAKILTTYSIDKIEDLTVTNWISAMNRLEKN